MNRTTLYTMGIGAWFAGAVFAVFALLAGALSTFFLIFGALGFLFLFFGGEALFVLRSFRTPAIKQFPLKANLWYRGSTSEWVLELTGVVRDRGNNAVYVSTRHVQPGTLGADEAVGLPTHYVNDEPVTVETAVASARTKRKPVATSPGVSVNETD